MCIPSTSSRFSRGPQGRMSSKPRRKLGASSRTLSSHFSCSAAKSPELGTAPLPRERGELLPPPLLRELEASVGPGRNGFELALELPPRTQPVELEPTLVDRSWYCPVGLPEVRAVA